MRVGDAFFRTLGVRIWPMLEFEVAAQVDDAAQAVAPQRLAVAQSEPAQRARAQKGAKRRGSALARLARIWISSKIAHVMGPLEGQRNRCKGFIACHKASPNRARHEYRRA